MPKSLICPNCEQEITTVKFNQSLRTVSGTCAKCGTAAEMRLPSEEEIASFAKSPLERLALDLSTDMGVTILKVLRGFGYRPFPEPLLAETMQKAFQSGFKTLIQSNICSIKDGMVTYNGLGNINLKEPSNDKHSNP